MCPLLIQSNVDTVATTHGETRLDIISSNEHKHPAARKSVVDPQPYVGVKCVSECQPSGTTVKHSGYITTTQITEVLGGQ